MRASEIFTLAELKAAQGKSHQELVEQVTPLMPRINRVTGTENDLGYMAYLLEYLSRLEKV